MEIQKVGLNIASAVVEDRLAFIDTFQDESAMHSQPATPLLSLKFPDQPLTGFASLLQHGILFPVQQPVPLVPFLLSLPGFTAEYIEQTVQTIFINGEPADSLQRELGAGTTLALSAAMPGLAGAIFRRQGVHGSLRTRPPEQDRTAGVQEGYLTLKLFNSIAFERVGDLLTQGILITGKAWQQFAAMHGTQLQPPCTMALDGDAVDLQGLQQRIAASTMLKVQAILL